ncbi:MAG TPA: Crp/Fnr family transcriptional regulator [Pyrinomonadaceae bacterium]|nr:Crp/Fnr family transcriptional regulator [Pyrinomonadaceae bacterium]
MRKPEVSRPLRFPVNNQILMSLPRDEYHGLLTGLTPVRLPQGKVLWEVEERITRLYFPTSGMISLVSTTESGSVVEVGMIGNEGVAGLSGLLGCSAAPYRVVVQLPGVAMRIGLDAIQREFARGGRLQGLLLRYTHVLLMQISQSAACNRFHTAEQRLCRWLLTSRDRAGSDVFHLTQEFLAQMIGTPRSNVAMIAGGLKGKRLITIGRGRVEILDPRGLEKHSCECYKIVSDSLKGFAAA